MKHLVALIGALLALSFHTTSLAVTDIYLLLDGIPGESTAEGHEDEIDVFSFSWGLTSTSSGSGGGGGSGKAVFGDALWTQGFDRSVPAEFVATASGRAIRSAEFEFVKPGTAKNRSFASFLFEDVFLTSLNVGFSSSADPVAALSLAYGKVTLSYSRQRADGSFDAPIRASWDLRTNKSFAESFSGDPGALAGLLEVGALSATGNRIFFTTAVPEPSTYALMFAGLVVVGTIARRRGIRARKVT